MVKGCVLYIELQGVYDGWSVVVYEDGTMHNRWDPEDGSRFSAAQEFIEQMGGVFNALPLKEEQND